MRIAADTNILVRAAAGHDDPAQTRAARAAMLEVELVCVPVAALCEFVWVLKRGYRYDDATIARAIGVLMASATVRLDRPAVEAGLAMLSAGGDFADGCIAFEGRRLGGKVFCSFDRQAVRLVQAGGGEAVAVS